MLIGTFIFHLLCWNVNNSSWMNLRLSAREAVWMERDQMKDLLFIIMSLSDSLIVCPLKIISFYFSAI